jgi:uncharacterized protein (TIGR02996 family)
VADLEALLTTIYERPEDDAVRSVYADALQEVGDPRGEFISLQLHQPTNPRARDLATRFANVWLGELAPVVIASEWKRGFLHTVVVDTFRSGLFPRLTNKREWATVRLVELGGHVTRDRSHTIPTHQKLVVEALMRAPGAVGRTFRPSYAEIQAGITNDHYVLR